MALTKSRIKVLVADDDNKLRKVLSQELSEENFVVHEADNGPNTIKLFEENEYDVILLDLNMPGIGGIEVLKTIKRHEIPTEVIIFTGHSCVPTAVEAMKLGACDYLTKPFRIEKLKTIIQKAYEKKRLLTENLLLKTQIRRESEKYRIIAKSPLIMELLENVKKIALSDFPVLVCGESGVGKELIARRLHEESSVSDGPFIPINCGAIPENMLESELFGHEKGAFTGAHARKFGLLEIADHGTLFLDEIGELSLPLQVKLLRVIETGTFFRVGGTGEIHVTVRFVSATNKDLKEEGEKGNFRQDLYYRINALALHIPPLRERNEDVLALIDHFTKGNPAFKKKRFSKAALKVLSGYPWPGNVRELQNVVHRTLLLSNNNIIEPSDLPIDIRINHKPYSKRLEDIEKKHILRVLEEVEGRRGKASEILDIDPKTLYRKLIKFGVQESKL